MEQRMPKEQQTVYLSQPVSVLIEGLRSRDERRLKLGPFLDDAVRFDTPDVKERFAERQRNSSSPSIQPKLKERTREAVHAICKQRKADPDVDFDSISAIYEEALCRHLVRRAADFSLTDTDLACTGYTTQTVPGHSLQDVRAVHDVLGDEMGAKQIVKRLLSSTLAPSIKDSIKTALNIIQTTKQRTTPALWLSRARRFYGEEHTELDAPSICAKLCIDEEHARVILF
jgi:hypothetical protein